MGKCGYTTLEGIPEGGVDRDRGTRHEAQNKFGYKASNEQFAPKELLRYGILAEEHGFDSVFVSDHLQPWRHDGGHAPFAMSWLAALGASTDHVTMGTSVLTPTFRYHPAIVAQAFATLGLPLPGTGRARVWAAASR